MRSSKQNTYEEVLTAFLESYLSYDVFNDKPTKQIAQDILDELYISRDAKFDWDSNKTELIKLDVVTKFSIYLYFSVTMVYWLVRLTNLIFGV